MEKEFLNEIRNFKENMKMILTKPEDEELRGFVRKYLEKAYENVCEL